MNIALNCLKITQILFLIAAKLAFIFIAGFVLFVLALTWKK